MDVHKALRELYEEKRRLDEAIERMERRLVGVAGKRTPGRRGRKNMGAEERAEVSRRMRAYWEARRAQRKKERPNGCEESPCGNG